MAKPFDRQGELAYVADVRSYDDVALWGDVYLPGLKDFCGSVDHIRSASMYKRALESGRIHSRAFVGPDVRASWTLLERLASLRSYDRSFLACFLGRTPEELDDLEQLLTDCLPYGEWWRCDTNVGEVLLASFKPEDAALPPSWEEVQWAARRAASEGADL